MSLSLSDLDRLLSELEEKHRRELERHEGEIKTLQMDRETLERMRDFAIRYQVPSTNGVHLPPAKEVPLSGRLTATRGGKKTDRYIIREFLAGWSGSFTVPDVIAAATRAGNTDAAALTPLVWSSTIHWLIQNGLVAVVEPRKGKRHGRYRVTVSPDEFRTPKRRPAQNGFPLQSIVYDGIQSISLQQFGRKELTESILKEHPEYAERLTVDLVGASLHRLAAEKKIGVTLIKKSNQGNIYGKNLPE